MSYCTNCDSEITEHNCVEIKSIWLNNGIKTRSLYFYCISCFIDKFGVIEDNVCCKCKQSTTDIPSGMGTSAVAISSCFNGKIYREICSYCKPFNEEEMK